MATQVDQICKKIYFGNEDVRICLSYFSVPHQSPRNLTKGSVVEYSGKFGVIKWIGFLPDFGNQMAGLEMVCLNLSWLLLMLHHA